MTGFLSLRYITITVYLLVGIGTALFFNAGTLFAQITYPFYSIEYRPYKGPWLQLKTPHFRIIYQEGLDSVAYESGRILEQQYPLAQSLTGGNLKNFPLVITNYSDLSNGFVQSWNFKSEINLAPIKGKALNPRGGDWLETVLSHEILHATHGNIKGHFLLNSFGFLFGPDLTRSLNFYPPAGIHEGLAVYHEGKNTLSVNHGGRGNYGYFKAKYWANLLSDSPWSIGDGLIPTKYHYPLNRHYIAGYFFTEWLQETYGEGVLKESLIRHYNRFPLGLGVALRSVTESWPNAMIPMYRKWALDNYAIAHRARNKTLIDDVDYINPLNKDLDQRRPLWISPTKLLYVERKPHQERGIYLHDTETQFRRLITSDFFVEDYLYAVDQKSKEIIYAAYKRGPTSFNEVYSYLYRESFLEGTSKKALIPGSKRMFAPSVDPHRNSLWALKNYLNIAQIYEYQNNKWLQCSHFKNTRPISIAIHPSMKNTYAFLMQKRGFQGVWFVDNFNSCSEIMSSLGGAADIGFENASIIDIQWHPIKSTLLMSVDDRDGVRVVEYDLYNGQAFVKLDAEFAAYEASYSEDGKLFSFVDEQNQKNIIAVVDSSRVAADSFEWPTMNTIEIEKNSNSVLLGNNLLDRSANWTIDSYTDDRSWWSPRVILPQIIDHSGTLPNSLSYFLDYVNPYAYYGGFSPLDFSELEVGLFMQSTDILQEKGYRFSGTLYRNNLWYQMSYLTKKFWPGIDFTFYRRPNYFIFSPEEGASVDLISDKRGWSLGVPLSYRFPSLTRFTSISITPLLFVEGLRYIDGSGSFLSDYVVQTKYGLSSFLQLRVQQLTRDIQPRSGFITFISSQKTFQASQGSFILNNYRYTYRLNDKYAIYADQKMYLPVWKKKNISTLANAVILKQSNNLLFSTNNIRSTGFYSPVFPNSSYIGRFSTETIVPIWYADKGFFTVPSSLKAFYLKVFTHRLYDLANKTKFGYPTRTSFGAELNMLFNISNITLSAGFGWYYDVLEKKSDFFIGSF